MPSKHRFSPPISILLLCLVPLGFAIWVRIADPFGDQGMKNVMSAIGVLVAFVLWLVWFATRSAVPARIRIGSLVTLVSFLIAGAVLFRFEGVRGSMIPAFSWRWSGRGAPLVPEADTTKRAGLTVTASTDFPGFLGARRDATVRGVRLARDWDARPPRLLWRRDVGKAWSGFAIVGSVAVTQEQRGETEIVSAYDLEAGTILWTHSESAHKSHVVGGEGPRATPTIQDGFVYALGATGILVCLDGADGKLVWRRHLPSDFGLKPEQEERLVEYGRSTSPLIVGDDVIVPVGGEAPAAMPGIVALDKRTGAIRWQGPPRHVSCSSPSFERLAGRDQILVVNEDTVTGHDPANGSMLWEFPWKGRTSADPNCSQARVVGTDRVFVSKGYGAGCALFRIVASTDGTANEKNGLPMRVEPLWSSRRSLRTKFTNVVFFEGHAFGLSDGILECVELERGERVWKAGRYGHGQILLVTDTLLLLSEEGELLLLEASPERADHVIARMQVLDGITWNTLALSGDRLVVRNANEAAAYRLPLSDD
ncbi:MAG: PQQ-binding-like beta-propeller repeat protein [Planctomycetes bacterium]|nr:PQQ-binding-like beta-propeller repeat protein [Planctomycetota bacterium]MCB9917012.1 PQQ-binding-like beta-propeller repeat protein [Planctomycetota bacterium]